MSKTKTSRETALEIIAACEGYLAAGYHPPGLSIAGSNKTKSATRRAAEQFANRIPYKTIICQLGTPDLPGTFFSLYGLAVDWTKYRPAEIAAPNIGPGNYSYTLLQDENRELRRQLKEAHRASGTEEIVREIVGKIVEAPRESPSWATDPPKREKLKPTPEVPVTIWSDWHIGEVVEKAEVNGFNSFNMAVAEERVHRLVDTTLNLCRNYHVGVYPGIVCNLLGDFVSGGIHPELKATDEEEVIPSCIKAVDWLVGGLTRFADYFGHVYVPGSCGNHGRDTVKPEFKRYYRKNFDWLILQFVARHFADDKRFRFDIRPSNDVHYRVHGEQYLACHGDMLGVRGGDGIIGSIGPIVRGEIKQAGQSSALGFAFNKLVIGHWHQRLWLPRAIVNNALKGFDEYAMKALGAKPDRPTQAIWWVHPEHGMTAQRDIFVDDKPKATAEWVAWGTTS